MLSFEAAGDAGADGIGSDSDHHVQTSATSGDMLWRKTSRRFLFFWPLDAPFRSCSSHAHRSSVELSCSQIRTSLFNCLAIVIKVPETGNTGLHVAAYGGRLKCLEYLLSQGGDILKKNHRGQTPAMLAALAGRTDVLKWLLENAKGTGEVPANVISDVCVLRTTSRCEPIDDLVTSFVCWRSAGWGPRCSTGWGRPWLRYFERKHVTLWFPSRLM